MEKDTKTSKPGNYTEPSFQISFYPPLQVNICNVCNQFTIEYSSWTALNFSRFQ